MAVIINASTSTGLVQSADTSGIIQFQSNGSTKATLNSSGFSYPGAVLQVVSAIKTDTSSTSSTTFGDISGLSVSITPTSSSSKILVFLNVDGSNDAGGMAVRLVRDSTAIAIGTAASGNQTNTTLTNYYNNTDANSHRSSGITFLDSPATTSATTYKAQFRVGTSGNGYINRSTGTDNAAYNMYAVSTITVMEIAA